MCSSQGGRFRAYHQTASEAFFYHVPGLRLAMPSNPRDAKGLFKTAVRDDSPVVFIEHKRLYETTGEVPEEEYTIPFGSAAVLREGTDCTIVGYSLMALRCVEAACVLAREGISCEVIDLRTLVPLDMRAVLGR